MVSSAMLREFCGDMNIPLLEQSQMAETIWREMHPFARLVVGRPAVARAVKKIVADGWVRR